MQEQEITPTADYVKGFNEGYLIAQHEPELAAQLSKAEGTSDRLQGIKDGHRRFTLEKEIDQSLSKMNFGKSEQAAPGKEKDRDIEQER